MHAFVISCFSVCRHSKIFVCRGLVFSYLRSAGHFELPDKLDAPRTVELSVMFRLQRENGQRRDSLHVSSIICMHMLFVCGNSAG